MLDAGSWLRLESAAQTLAEVSGRIGQSVDVDVRELLTQRGLSPRGTVSANGSCRLLATKDGWAALSLNRPDDWDLLPAVFKSEHGDWDWAAVAAAVTTTSGDELEVSAVELGLALAVLPAQPPRVDEPWDITWTRAQQDRSRPARVVDMSALWAGPLCTSLLRQAGADVISVASTTRPASESAGVSLDFSTREGRAELQRLIGSADIVVSSARIRALQQLGIDPFSSVERWPGLTWVGISAYGLAGRDSNRVGYGDDTAVAGGLVRRVPTPAFVGDAIADPITGLYAAIGALEVFAAGGGIVDIALRNAAAYVAGASS